MTSQGAIVLVVVCEADADRRIACDLADRVLCREVEWLEPETLAACRDWRGLEEGSSHLTWTQAVDLSKESRLKPHGHFEGRPKGPDALAARRVFFLLRKARLRPDAVILVRDSDGNLNRLTGLEQARAEWREPIPIVLGLAHPKREAWVLAGFEPKDETEKAAVAAARKSLGFDPRTSSHQLHASKHGALRDAKRVLAELTDGRWEREEACWRESRLELLLERGAENGLARYVEEVRERLVPLFKGSPAGSARSADPL